MSPDGIFVSALVFHLILVATTFTPSVLRFLDDHRTLPGRLTLFNFQIWVGLGINLGLVARFLFDGLRCWSHLLLIFMDPVLILLPTFFHVVEHLRLAARQPPPAGIGFGRLLLPRRPVNLGLFAGLLLGHLILAALCLAYRFASLGGLGAISDRCELSFEIWLMGLLYLAYVGLGGWALVLLRQQGGEQRGELGHLEFYLSFGWALITMTPFIIISLSDGAFRALQRTPFPPELLVLLFNMRPALFSAVIPLLLAACTGRRDDPNRTYLRLPADEIPSDDDLTVMAAGDVAMVSLELKGGAGPSWDAPASPPEEDSL